MITASEVLQAALEILRAGFASPAVPAACALVAGALLVVLERRTHARALALPPVLLIGVLAGFVTLAPRLGAGVAPLAIAFVIAILARDPRNTLHSECGLKLLWVMGGALALSWGGLALLEIATGTSVVSEQWAVLGMGLVPRLAWSTALALGLIVGVVMLGAAPFHSWVADLFQGGRPWLAPLAVAAIQVTGAMWLARRLEGVEAFPAGAEVTGVLLSYAAGGAFVIGAATLFGQRRPERRVGTLASLQGGLVLATLAAVHGRTDLAADVTERVSRWSGHLVLALAGAATLARFMPVPASPDAPGGTLFRRHPWTGLVGLFALASLAGVPGTPGARLWLDTARDLVAASRPGLLLALAVGWFTAFATVMQQVRDSFGARRPGVPGSDVPWEARAALWMIGVALAGLAVSLRWV